jgi:hypothetical protein
MTVTISVAKDFTRFPSGRYVRNGETSGEAFRQKFLEPHLRDGEVVEVDLDGTVGYGSSFLEEAFGGLVRALRIPSDRLLTQLKVITSDDSLREEVTDYIRDAGRRAH